MSSITTIRMSITRRPFLSFLENNFNLKTRLPIVSSAYTNCYFTTYSQTQLNRQAAFSSIYGGTHQNLHGKELLFHDVGEKHWSTTICLPCIRNYSQSSSVSDQNNPKDIPSDDVDEEKLGLVARFKLMYKRYWYVLVPVHLVTSTGWLCGFYYLSQSGVDIPAVLDMLHVSQSIIEKLKHSSTGHLAIAYLCYKLATPVRYMVTLGGTTISIKYLSQWGYIKPVPSKEQFRQMYAARKDQIKRGYEEFQEKRQEITQKTTNKSMK